MVAKVKIKAGPIEFEYEGQTDLSISDIKELFSQIEVLFTVPSLGANDGDAGGSDEQTDDSALISRAASNLHVNSIANKLGAKTGTDLALAAAAYLQVVAGRQSFSRQELLNTMKEAKRYYKVGMSKNLTNHINSLLGNKFNQIGQEQYSLSSGEHDRLEKSLA